MLDPERQADALERIREIQEEQKHHDKMASTARSKIALLTRTWQLCPVPHKPGLCCGDPVTCTGRAIRDTIQSGTHITRTKGEST